MDHERREVFQLGASDDVREVRQTRERAHCNEPEGGGPGREPPKRSRGRC